MHNFPTFTLSPQKIYDAKSVCYAMPGVGLYHLSWPETSPFKCPHSFVSPSSLTMALSLPFSATDSIVTQTSLSGIMGRYEWTEEEKALAVYFRYLGVRCDGISQLLENQGFMHSERAVSGIIRSIQNNEGLAINTLTRSEADALIDRVASGYDISCFLLPMDGISGS